MEEEAAAVAALSDKPGMLADCKSIFFYRSRYNLSDRFEILRPDIDQIDRQTVVRDDHIFTISFSS